MLLRVAKGSRANGLENLIADVVRVNGDALRRGLERSSDLEKRPLRTVVHGVQVREVLEAVTMQLCRRMSYQGDEMERADHVITRTKPGT